MDNDWIDRLARQLAPTTSRRGVLRLGLGAALAGWAFAGDEATAACRPPKKPCTKAKQCCTGTCKKGKCAACPNGRSFCTDTCADLQTDDDHCGACGTVCGAGQRCAGGTCICDAISCAGCCDGTTCHVDNATFCGANGGACHACGLGQDCVGGVCACTAASCPLGCCAGTTCEPASNVFCGINGGPCASCGGGEVCLDGICTG